MSIDTIIAAGAVLTTLIAAVTFAAMLTRGAVRRISSSVIEQLQKPGKDTLRDISDRLAVTARELAEIRVEHREKLRALEERAANLEGLIREWLAPHVEDLLRLQGGGKRAGDTIRMKPVPDKPGPRRRARDTP